MLDALDAHDGLIQAVAILVAIATFLITFVGQNRRDREVANREMYQRLELASVDLFRFEVDHLEQVGPIWQPGVTPPAPATAQEVALTNYVCQMLNLFEMAIAFRKSDVLPEEVFGTWAMWFYDLCAAPGFSPVWQRVRHHYTPKLRAIMSHGVGLAAAKDADQKGRQRFFDYLGDDSELRCPSVKTWLS